MKNYFLSGISLIPLTLCWSISISVTFAQSFTIHFAVDMRAEKAPGQVGVRGNLPPLSWEKTFPLADTDGDGIFTGSLQLDSKESRLEYKFVKQASAFELDGADNRVVHLDKAALTVAETFNVLRPLSPTELAALRFSPAAIREDLAILKRALTTIHPNLYRYRDSLEFKQDLMELEANMIAENDLPSAYKHLSRFIAGIQCSHTALNPWNQPPLMKRALYYQRDKLPFSFQLINGRMFIDRNASEDHGLEKGTEVLAIDGVSMGEILNRLMAYISADGENAAKKEFELQLSGTEKYETFDILFPLEFGAKDHFQLELLDHRSGQNRSVRVKPQSTFQRRAALQERYPDLLTTADARWAFRLLSDKTAYLKLGTFTVWNMEMDWKKYLQSAFRELRSKHISSLIIDIRDNVGGLDEVYAFILQRLLSEPITLEDRPDKVGYRSIPQSLRPFLNTWDQRVFDFGEKAVPQPDGNYVLDPEKNAVTTFQPRRDGYRGHTYLITNPANSSATHQMAKLMKDHHLGTLVGRTTGGNQRGLNGGIIFFTVLPNTQIEVDIPVIGSYTLPDTPNGGIVPDLPVEPTVEDYLSGKDRELEYILQLIR